VSPPVVNDQSFNIVEGSANGASVGTVVANDADVGDALSYSITAGNAGGAFAIDGSTGEITVANPNLLDFETTPLFNLTVKVVDAALMFDSATVTINVANVNPSTPVDIDVSADSVAEGAANGTAVGITASSKDPNGPAAAYSLTDSAGGRFAIDSNTGVVTVADGTLLNFDSATSHMITVQANAGAGATSTADFTISVANVAPTVVSPIADVTANEDQVDTVINLAGVYADTHAGDSLTLSVSSNSNSGLVTASLVGNTLTLNYQLDQNGTATITIRATDLGGLFVEDTFVVTVLSADNQLGNLMDLINALTINHGNKNSLIKKLESAQNSLAQDNTIPAVNKMDAFINEVEAFHNSGKLTGPEANSLIAGANAIKLSML
jgi:hypothetical protein